MSKLFSFLLLVVLIFPLSESYAEEIKSKNGVVTDEEKKIISETAPVVLFGGGYNCHCAYYDGRLYRNGPTWMDVANTDGQTCTYQGHSGTWSCSKRTKTPPTVY